MGAASVLYYHAMRVLAGGLIAGGILWMVAGADIIGGLVAGLLTASLMRQLGPRSLAEKVGAAMTAALIAWAAGPGAGADIGLIRFLFGWLLSSSALAYVLHPKTE